MGVFRIRKRYDLQNRYAEGYRDKIDNSVALDPTKSNTPVTVDGITSVVVNGRELGVGGYLDIGLIDTMKDLIVNFIGAVVFSIFGFIYIKYRGRKSRVVENFMVTVRKEEEKSDE